VKRLTGFLIIFFFTACSNRTGIPEEVIPPDSMEKIMKDIIMAEQYSNQYILKDSLRTDKQKANQDLLEAIFKLHHTTRKSFQESLNYYESRPDLNMKIFDSLSVYANQHRAELYAPKAPVKLHPDTLK
jgi:hypothetical protein